MSESNILYEDVYDKKFSFGKNWQDFLKKLNKEKIELAKKSLTDFTKLKDFKGKVFLDIGCGSGLFSLAAVLLGAKKVISVDIDKNSVSCAVYLRKKYKISDSVWEIKTGSALDLNFLKSLPKADIVYSWGVLHHTGNMWRALDNVNNIVKKDALLYIALYNDFSYKKKNFINFLKNIITPSSSAWVKIKRFYANSSSFVRVLMQWGYVVRTFFLMSLRLRNPFAYAKNYGKGSSRGMSYYRDVVDWLGGYPYEYISVDNLVNYYKKEGFVLKNINKVISLGCNEFLFERK